MRVTGIYNNISFNIASKIKKQKEAAFCTPYVDTKNKNDSCWSNDLSFFGNIIYFNNYHNKKNDERINPTNDAQDFFAVQYFLNLPILEDTPQDIVSVFNSAYVIQNTAAPFSERFKNVYNYASAVVYDVYKNLLSDKNSWCCFRDDNKLIELDERGKLLRETTFCDDFPEVIRDYKNNRVIFVESEKGDGNIEDFTVCLKCKNIDDTECIKARESFSYKGGRQYRYCAAVAKDVNSDRFIASRAYTYKNGKLAGYDSQLAIACGTEYSSEYYEFLPKISQRYSSLYGESVPVRFVTNKIVANGYLIRSSKEISLSRYLKDYAGC